MLCVMAEAAELTRRGESAVAAPVGVDPRRAKAYTAIRHRLMLLQTLLGVLVPLLLWWSDVARPLADFSAARGGSWLPAAMLFFTCCYAALWLLGLPLSLYSGYFLEHRFKLSNQTLAQYAGKKAKETALGLLLAVGMLTLLYYGIGRFGDWWWLPVALLFFCLSILLAELFPLLIIPLFYKTSPLPEGELRDRLTAFLRTAGVGNCGLFQIDFSKETKKANAMFTGWGKSRRVLLTDTLVHEFSPAEIEAVLAHELGHRRYRHIVKLMVVGFIGSMLQFWLIGRVLAHTPGLASPADLAGFPVLWLGFALMSMLAQPLMAGLSRHYERQADAYACAEPARAAAMASALARLGETNLSDPEPPAWVEWYFYSHPALARRIAAARARGPA